MADAKSFVIKVVSSVVSFVLIAPMLALFLSFFFNESVALYSPSQKLFFEYVSNSVFLAFFSVLLALVWGIGSAWFVAYYDFPLRKLLCVLLFLPLAVPAYISAFVYGELFEYAGPIQSFLRDIDLLESQWGDVINVRSMWGASLVLSFALYPYVYLIMYTHFRRCSELFSASRCFGICGWKRFWNIGVQAQRPALVAGGGLVAMEVLSDFGVVDYFAVDTLTTAIYDAWFGYNAKIVALRYALLLFAVVVLVLVVEKIFRKNIYKYQHVNGDICSEKLKHFGAVCACLFCLVPVIGGLLLPVGQLVLWSVSVDTTSLFADVFIVVVNTMTVASIAALLAVCLAVLLLWSSFFAKQYKLPVTVEWLSSGYAIPGTVVAIAVLWSFGWVDSQLGGLYFSGSLFALIFAYLFRFIKIAINPIDSTLSTVSKDCFSFLAIVSVPLEKRLLKGYGGILSPAMMLAFIFVFVECVKELPATLVIRPFNFETLSTYTYQLASDERVHDASLSALFIVMFALLPVYIIWLRLNKRGNV